MEKQIYVLGVAILGEFTPTIVTPQWLASKNLIREVEAETAKIEIIHQDIARFELDWLSIEVRKDRMDFTTKSEPHFIAMKDLITSVFAILKETPVRSFGINHLIHYTLPSDKDYENFGYWFSPVKVFGSVLNVPKLQSISYQETSSGKLEQGVMRLTISPSDLISDGRSVVLNCNHHFEDTGSHSARKAMELLNTVWDLSYVKAEKLNLEIWNQVNK